MRNLVFNNSPFFTIKDKALVNLQTPPPASLSTHILYTGENGKYYVGTVYVVQKKLPEYMRQARLLGLVSRTDDGSRLRGFFDKKHKFPPYDELLGMVLDYTVINQRLTVIFFHPDLPKGGECFKCASLVEEGFKTLIKPLYWGPFEHYLNKMGISYAKYLKTLRRG